MILTRKDTGRNVSKDEKPCLMVKMGEMVIWSWDDINKNEFLNGYFLSKLNRIKRVKW
ncbi:hypothetical protein HanHA300_Chr15g0588531 [Helianthus annuus]|nr:hypothetical protein HanHA300_Chr15g0588531 [Helianthus annuus]KAJ0475202.1 hypothetical protein HanHA89_Chr15g0638461 [Helianthus annuus]KAJ0654508.1 hypothetical protein HanOQP8_Chr15g0595781 [Helianthus annuus]